ncbi:MAG: ABC transporter permease [Thermoplasmatota archaeon]
MISLLGPAFADQDGGISFDEILEVLGDQRSRSIISFTIFQALVSTFLTLALAFPGAYLLSSRRIPGRSLLLSLTTVPFVLPPLVLGVGFMALFSGSGWVQVSMDGISSIFGLSAPDIKMLYSKEAVVLAHVFLNFPIALRFLTMGFLSVDGDFVRASRSLGAGPVRTFSRIILPQMRYSIISAASLIFTFCLVTFGAVLVIGGMGNATIEVEIYRQFTGKFDDGRAAAMLLVEIVLVAISTSVYIWSSRRSGLHPVGKGTGRTWMGSPTGSKWRSKRALIFIYGLIVFFVILLPLAAVVLESFATGSSGGAGYTFRWYEALLARENDPTIGVSPLGAVINSLMFGFLTMVLSIPLSLLTAYAIDRPPFRGKIFLDSLLLFPLGVSTVALGLGFIKGFNQGWLDLTGSWIAVVVVHTMIAYPLGVRAITAAKRSIPDSVVKAARTLGASRLEAFLTVEMPLLAPGLLIAAIFAFAVSIGEFGATLMVSSSEYTTMPLALYKFISGGREFGVAYAYAVVLMLVTFLSIFAMDVIGRRFLRLEVDI